MEAIMNLFLGDPIYDRNGRMVKRDFGVKNILMIVVVGYIGYFLIKDSKVEKKMKGGEGRWEKFKEAASTCLSFTLGGSLCIGGLYIAWVGQYEPWFPGNHAVRPR